MSRPIIKPYTKERRFAEIASQNFLAAFGVYLAEKGWSTDDVYEALRAIDGIMCRDDNAENLEKLTGIRLNVRG